jgi:hypothetical protein
MKTWTLLLAVVLIYFGFSGKWRDVLAAAQGKT